MLADSVAREEGGRGETSCAMWCEQFGAPLARPHGSRMASQATAEGAKLAVGKVFGEPWGRGQRGRPETDAGAGLTGSMGVSDQVLHPAMSGR